MEMLPDLEENQKINKAMTTTRTRPTLLRVLFLIKVITSVMLLLSNPKKDVV